MGKSKHHIPILRTSDECRDWLDRNKPLPTVHRGDIWFARLGKHKYSSVQEGIRPVLIISNEKNNRRAGTVTVIPFTGHLKRTDMPTHVIFDRITKEKNTGMSAVGENPGDDEKSVALVEQMTTIDKRRLLNKAGKVDDEEKMKEIDRAVRIQLGLEKSE